MVIWENIKDCIDMMVATSILQLVWLGIWVDDKENPIRE